MNKVMQELIIVTDPMLSQEISKELINEIILDWQWEGKKPGRIEIVSDGQLIQALVYGQPSILTIPALTCQGGAK